MAVRNIPIIRARAGVALGGRRLSPGEAFNWDDPNDQALFRGLLQWPGFVVEFAPAIAVDLSDDAAKSLAAARTRIMAANSALRALDDERQTQIDAIDKKIATSQADIDKKAKNDSAYRDSAAQKGDQATVDAWGVEIEKIEALRAAAAEGIDVTPNVQAAQIELDAATKALADMVAAGIGQPVDVTADLTAILAAADSEDLAAVPGIGAKGCKIIKDAIAKAAAAAPAAPATPESTG